METNKLVRGTFTFQSFGGGVALNKSTSTGSCPVTYEASTFVAPSIAAPGFRTNRIT